MGKHSVKTFDYKLIGTQIDNIQSYSQGCQPQQFAVILRPQAVILSLSKGGIKTFSQSTIKLSDDFIRRVLQGALRKAQDDSLGRRMTA